MAAGGRHSSPGSEFTLNGTTAFSLPVSSTTATAERSSPPPNSSNQGPRARRPVHQAHNVETEVDVWLVDPAQQQQQQERQQPTEAGQPDFSFPVISSSAYSPPPSPPPKDAPALASKSGFYSKSSSIAQARQHKQRNLNWRDKGQEIARLRKKAASNQGLTVQQIAGGAGTLAVLMLVVILWASRQGKSPIVKHMQRREQILAASLAPAAPNIAKQKAVRPHDSFRDELSTDSKYLISPPHGDFAEQTMNLYHLTHLSTILQRIPIAHPFLLPDPDKSTLTTSHPVSTIFDMSRFSAGTSVAVLDWNDLRPHEAAEAGKTEPLGCWIGMLGEEERIERARKMQMTGLSPSFVPVRLALGQKESGQGDDLKETHAFLSRFDRDSTAKMGLIDQAKHDSSISTTGSTRRHANPENHVFCIDHSLYRPEHPTTKHSTTHLDPRDHTAFFKHGRHMHFAADVHEAAGDIVAYLLGHRAPFIAVHISARAKASECRLLNQPDRCQPNLIEYQRAADRVKHLVAQGAGRKSREHRHSARNLSIIVSTDVKDLAFLGELANLGWTLLDYDDGELRERFGRWDPQVMDQAIESRSAAFVGTRGCPQSTLSALRVRTWRTGPTELI